MPNDDAIKDLRAFIEDKLEELNEEVQEIKRALYTAPSANGALFADLDDHWSD